MRRKIKAVSLMFMITLLAILTVGCQKNKKSNTEYDKLDESFAVIAELCKANFAPSTHDEYEECYKKYSTGEYIEESALTAFMQYPDKELNYDVKLSSYECKYIMEKATSYYEATMHLENSYGVYMDIKVRFNLNNGRICSTATTDNHQDE